MKTTVAAIFVLAGLSFAGGCGIFKDGPGDQEVHTFPGASAMNSTCGCGHQANLNYTCDWNGGKFACCSMACSDKFNRMTDAQKQEFVWKAQGY